MGPKVVSGKPFEQQASQGGASRAGIDRGPCRLQGGGFAGEKPGLAEALLRGSEARPEGMDGNHGFEPKVVEGIAVKLPGSGRAFAGATALARSDTPLTGSSDAGRQSRTHSGARKYEGTSRTGIAPSGKSSPLPASRKPRARASKAA